MATAGLAVTGLATTATAKFTFYLHDRLILFRIIVFIFLEATSFIRIGIRIHQTIPFDTSRRRRRYS